MQAKFPSQLGNREPMIKRVDLGDKGIYFRAMVGPFASGNEASEVCSSLKSAGGQCIVQKI
jgi:cell division protein FtsN